MLTVKDLSFSFRQLKLFNKLSFKVYAGDLLVVSGPNGCGKSTLLSLLIGSRKSEGSGIEYDSDLFPGEYLGAENNHHFLKRSATANLKTWAELLQIKLTETDLQKELKFWNLGHPFFSNQLPVSRFSTGMKRRLALARVCLSPKKLWLLDEPLFGLDVEAIEIFKTRLESHISQGGAAVIVSHDDRLFKTLPHQKLELLKYKEKV